MFKITMQLPTLAHGDDALWQRVLPRFQKEAGELIVGKVRSLLGQDSTYSLTEAYAQRKVAGKTRPKMKRYAGMSSDEPLILGGSMCEGISAEVVGGLLVVGVEAGAGVSESGFDYAEHWEQETDFLEKGFQEVEGELPGLLETIIVEEMLLGL